MKAIKWGHPAYIFGALLSVFFVLLSFQNCSNDTGFIADPSVAQPFVNTNPPRIGGNENVVIRVNQYPGNNVIDDSNSVIDYEVTSPEPGTTITDVKCTLDGENIDCDAVDSIPIDGQALGLGTHTFTIEGTNSNGETGIETIIWTTFSGIVSKKKNINVGAVNDNADIIINIDNSGSMKFEQTSMAQRIGAFMAKFANLDYRIMVTTTHPGVDLGNANAPYSNGRGLKYPDDSYCLTTATASATAQQYLGQTVQRPESEDNDNGSGYERGIYTTRLLIERAGQNGSNESGCLRAGIAKHVILISDEDETLTHDDDSSFGDEGDPVFEQEQSDGANLRAFMGQTFPNAAFKFHSIIVNPFNEEGRTCLDGEGAKFGSRYADLSLATGGVIGTVCAADYASQLEEIGQSVSNSSKIYPLGCIAVSNGQQAGTVTRGGAPIATPWRFSGDNIEFDANLQPGDYTITYFCYE